MRLFLVCVFFLPCLCQSNDPSRQILLRHAESIGSLQAWRSLESVTYRLLIKEPGFEVQAVYRIKRTGKMRIDVFSDGQQVFTEAYNGELGWQWQPTEATASIIAESSAAALRHGIELPGHLYTLLDMERHGHRLDYLGVEEHAENTAHLLRLTLKDGHEKYYVLDAETAAILATRDKRAFHPDIDPEEVIVESRPSDYRDVGGMIKPFRNDNWDLTNNKWLGTTWIKSVKVDAPIDDLYFEPSSVEALPIDGQ